MLFTTHVSRRSAGLELVGALAALIAAGCGGGTAPVPVQGIVTLDGIPLEGATVLFRPDNGRPSAGKTDAEGRYRLRYTSERAGAVPGRHAVSISMLDDDGGDDEGGASKRRKEPIPARYNAATELTAEVTGSKMELNFALESQ